MTLPVIRRRISSSVCYHDSNEEDVLAEMMVFEVRPPNCCILCIINTSLFLYNSRVSDVGITELISVVVAGWVQQYANYSGIPTSKAHRWDCGAGEPVACVSFCYNLGNHVRSWIFIFFEENF